MRQYEIRWANLPVPIGRCPVLVLTTTIRGIPQEVLLGKKEGLQHESVANMDNIHVIPKALLGDRIGLIGPARESDIKRALGYALEWPELKVL